MHLSATGKAQLSNLVFDCDLEIDRIASEDGVFSLSIELQPLPVGDGLSLEGNFSDPEIVSFMGSLKIFDRRPCALRPMSFIKTGDRLIGQIELGKQLNDYFYLIAKE